MRVVELCDDSAAFAGRLLAGVGAEVIRLEPLGAPAEWVWEGTELDYLHMNAGKQVVTLDAGPGPSWGQAAAEHLAQADALVTSWPGDRLRAAGIDVEGARRANPALVSVSVTPFGSSGRRAQWTGTDLTACAMGGMMAMIGDPDGEPLRPPRQQAYHLAGANAAIGVLLGVLARARTGRGQAVEVSVQEVVASTLEFGTLAAIFQDREVGRHGSRYSHAPHLVVATADGHVAGGFGGTARMWTGLVEWLAEMGAAEDLGDEKWSDEARRFEERDHIFAVLARAFGRLSTAVLAAQASARGMPWAPVSTAEEVLENPQLASRQFFDEVLDVGSGRRYRDAGLGFRLPFAPREVPRPGRRSPPGASPTGGPPGAGPHGPGGPGGLGRPGTGGDLDPLEAGPVPATEGLPLQGVRVLDLTWVLAGPFATKILADFGAEVIKVESRLRPDPTRYARSMRFSRHDDGDPDTSGYFANVNRNKKSILVNLKDPEGVAAILALTGHCDVLVENYRAGTLERLGLSEERLREARPDLVLVRMSGVGQDGPLASASTFADSVAAMSALTSETALADGQPRGVTFGLGDMIAGYHAALATLGALFHRRATGEGCLVDLSQVECTASQMGAAFLEVQAGVPCPVGGPNVHPRMAPHGVYPCQGEDQWCAIAVPSDQAFGRLCRAIGRLDLAGDPALQSATGRIAQAARLDQALTLWTTSRTAPQVMAILQDAGVAAGVVQGALGLLDDQHLAARGFYPTVVHPKMGPVVVEGLCVRLCETPGSVRTAAPLLGADTRAVLQEIAGIDPARLDALAAAGVLA